jgi:S1-C subfamily serine protease
MTLARAVAFAAAVSSALGVAQANAPMPTLPAPGANSAAAAPTLGDLSGAGRAPGDADPARIEKVLKSALEALPPSRGPGDQAMFNRFARSVVLIVTKETLGSGAVVARDGTIVTNAHVLRGQRTVGIILKPLAAGVVPREADAVKGAVVRVDEVADLAVIKVAQLPPDVQPIALADTARIAAGAGIHAIGHPFGEIWSYARGVVRQVHLNYTWRSADGGQHRADVVQAQTPINPGNSGAPLLNDAGELVGVSAFGAEVNFAVAASEARRVLAMGTDRLMQRPTRADAAPSAKKICAPVHLGAKRALRNDATLFALDTNCDGRGDATLVYPDNRASPTMLMVDANGNGRIEATYIDKNNDMKFDYALFDTDEDGKADLVGYDLNDSLEPGRIVLAKS